MFIFLHTGKIVLFVFEVMVYCCSCIIVLLYNKRLEITFKI
jgi:hypothetical protein